MGVRLVMVGGGRALVIGGCGGGGGGWYAQTHVDNFALDYFCWAVCGAVCGNALGARIPKGAN